MDSEEEAKEKISVETNKSNEDNNNADGKVSHFHFNAIKPPD